MTPAIAYVLILYLCAALLVFAAVYMLRYRKNSGSLFFVGLCISTAIYALGYSFEVISPNLENALVWSYVQYIGLSFLPTFLLLFIAGLVSTDRYVPRVLVFLGFLVSFVILIARQTNHLHHLFYFDETLVFKNSFSLLRFGRGPWYLVARSYNAFAMILSIALTTAYIGRAPKILRWKACIILLGLLISSVPYTVYYTFFMLRSDYVGLDLMPLGLALGTPFLLVALLNRSPYRLAPVGRGAVVESMPDAVVVLDASNVIVDANPAALAAFAKQGTDVVGSTIEMSFPAISEVAKAGGRFSYNGRSWEFTRKEIPEKYRHSRGVLLIGRDISERERLINRLEQMARVDGLTGLLNRHSWESAVRIELSRLSRYGRAGSVILLDLDHFKVVNDSYGHAAGDKVLVAVSAVLAAGVRKPDLVARYGGEEFIIFMPEAGPELAAEAAERLRAEIENTEVLAHGRSIRITASFGVAGCFVNTDTVIEKLVGYADMAMYRSKENGRNCVSIR